MLVVVVRRDPGTTNPFCSLLDAFQINIKALFLKFYCFSKTKTKKKKEKSLVPFESGPFLEVPKVSKRLGAKSNDDDDDDSSSI